MKTELLVRLKFMVEMYHKICKESEGSQVNWDTIMLKHSLDGCTYAHALRELWDEASDYCWAEVMREEYGTWGEHPDCPVKDWRYEVANGDTRLGYWEWCVVKLELRELEDKEPS